MPDSVVGNPLICAPGTENDGCRTSSSSPAPSYTLNNSQSNEEFLLVASLFIFFKPLPYNTNACTLLTDFSFKFMIELPSLDLYMWHPCFKIKFLNFNLVSHIQFSCYYPDRFFLHDSLDSQPSGTTKSHKIALAFGSSLGCICLLILGFGFLLWWRQRHNQQIFFDVYG